MSKFTKRANREGQTDGLTLFAEKLLKIPILTCQVVQKRGLGERTYFFSYEILPMYAFFHIDKISTLKFNISILV